MGVTSEVLQLVSYYEVVQRGLLEIGQKLRHQMCMGMVHGTGGKLSYLVDV